MMMVIDAIGGLMVRLMRAVLVPRRSRDRVARGRSPVVLVLQLDHLGDALLTTGMLGAIRRHLPDARIEVLCGPAGRAVFEVSPYVDHVHLCRANRFARGDRRRRLWPLGVLYWGLRLRRRRPGVVIDVRGELPHAVLAFLTGATRRVGWASGGGSFLLTDWPEYVPDRPEIESRAALLAVLGIDAAADTILPEWPAPSVDLPAVREVQTQLAAIEPAGPIVAMHLGAGTPAKCWPTAHWRDVIVRSIAEHNARIVLIGGLEDRIGVDDILMGIRSPRIVDTVGRFTLAETAEVLRRADLFIGADSGPAHLAGAVHTRSIVLFSGTNFADQWRPPGRHVTILRKDVPCGFCRKTVCPDPEHPCMRGISPEEVVAQVARYS